MTSLLETTIAFAIGYILAQIPAYFIQRYFFKKVMDKYLGRLESRFKRKTKKLDSRA